MKKLAMMMVLACLVGCTDEPQTQTQVANTSDEPKPQKSVIVMGRGVGAVMALAIIRQAGATITHKMDGFVKISVGSCNVIRWSL